MCSRSRKVGEARGWRMENGGRIFAILHPPFSILVFAVFIMPLVGPARAAAPASQPVLRVAADPNNLPFSNDRGEGFENKIAELVAADLGANLQYGWHAQRRGFFRETLKSGDADVFIGLRADRDLRLA